MPERRQERQHTALAGLTDSACNGEGGEGGDRGAHIVGLYCVPLVSGPIHFVYILPCHGIAAVY